MPVLRERWGKIKECCLSFGCLESISIVNDGSIGKLRPMNLNSFMANTIKQECSTQLAKVWIYFNKLNLKSLKLSLSLLLFRQYVILTVEVNFSTAFKEIEYQRMDLLLYSKPSTFKVRIFANREALL